MEHLYKMIQHTPLSGALLSHGQKSIHFWRKSTRCSRQASLQVLICSLLKSRSCNLQHMRMIKSNQCLWVALNCQTFFSTVYRLAGMFYGGIFWWVFSASTVCPHACHWTYFYASFQVSEGTSTQLPSRLKPLRNWLALWYPKVLQALRQSSLSLFSQRALCPVNNRGRWCLRGEHVTSKWRSAKNPGKLTPYPFTAHPHRQLYTLYYRPTPFQW